MAALAATDGDMKPHKNESDNSLRACGLRIEHHRHGPNFATATHKHPHHSLMYTVTGRGQCIIDGRSYSLEPNTAVLLQKHQDHQLVDEPGKPMVVFVVTFSSVIARANAQLLLGLRQRAVLSMGPHQAMRVRRTLRQALHEQDRQDKYCTQAMQQCLAAILLELGRCPSMEAAPPASSGDSSVRVRQVLEHVADRYYEPQSLSRAASMAHLSQRQFRNVFRKLAGASFVEHVNRVRVGRAEDLLRAGQLPISAIAFEVGFEDLSTFYRAFRKGRGISPQTYRKTLFQAPPDRALK